MRALQDECYEVLEDLKAGVLPATDREEALEGWAERWNLMYPWILAVARSTLAGWDDWAAYENRRRSFNRARRNYAAQRAEDPSLSPELRWELTWTKDSPLREPLPDLGEDLTLRFRPFNPYREKASEYRDRVETAVREVLREHIEEQRQLASEEGEETVSVEAGGKTEPAQRFRWLARRIVHRDTWEELASGTPVTYQAVQKHCRKLADLVGVDLPE